MHRILAMKHTDLAELYCLLHMYTRTYENPASQYTADLLTNIQSFYEEQAILSHIPPSCPPTLCNPRGAGRKKRYPDKIREQILHLHSSGLPIRAIASRIPCSVGYVHNLIHERIRQNLMKGEPLPYVSEEKH